MMPFRTAIVIPHYARSPGLANSLHAVYCLGSVLDQQHRNHTLGYVDALPAGIDGDLQGVGGVDGW